MPETATDRTGSWTFETLAEADRASLEDVLRAGSAPAYEQLDGYAYRGWNHGRVTTISGRKFRKVFRRRDGRSLGHNELVRQDGQGPGGRWEPKLKRGRAVELGYYRVARVADRPPGGLHDRYRHLALLDYDVALNTGRSFFLRVIRDFVALPNPGDHGLLLGKAYLQLGPRALSLFYTYFVLGHREPIEHEPR